MINKLIERKNLYLASIEAKKAEIAKLEGKVELLDEIISEAEVEEDTACEDTCAECACETPDCECSCCDEAVVETVVQSTSTFTMGI